MVESLATEDGILEERDLKTDFIDKDFDAAKRNALLKSGPFLLLAKSAENGDEGRPSLSVVQAQYCRIPVIVTKYAGWKLRL